MKLTVLVCTVSSRVGDCLPAIVRQLDKQTQKYKDVEFIYLGDNKKRKVGRKRNDLLKLAQGDYVCFVDDDDKLSEDYIDTIYNALHGGADVINFKVMCRVNKGKWKPVVYDANLKDKNMPNGYQRMPNHLMVIKRTLALSVGFMNLQSGEDFDFAQRLKEKIKTQTNIDKVLYWYDADITKSEAQK